MPYALTAAYATLIFALLAVVPRSARARRLARLFRAQQAWAELMDRESQPRQECPLAPPRRGPRKEDDPVIILPAESPALTVLLSEQPNGRR